MLHAVLPARVVFLSEVVRPVIQWRVSVCFVLRAPCWSGDDLLVRFRNL